MEERNYCIYMHKNKINNKVYIGITGRDPVVRWQNGNGYKYNQHFWNAIQKYGWNEGFDHIIIQDNLTEDEANHEERRLIALYNSANQDYGYNVSLGGNYVGMHSEDTRRKISEIQFKEVYQYDRYTGKFINKYQSTLQAEEILGIPNASISAVALKKMKTIHDYIFRYADDGYIEGINLPHEEVEYANTNNCYVKVAQYDLNGNFIKLYDKVIDACNELGFDDSRINFHNKTSFGYIWKKIEDANIDYTLPLSKEELSKYSKDTINAKSCYQYDLNGKFITSYISTTKASEINDINQSNIAAVCRGEYQIAGGYYWRYAENVPYGIDLSYEEINKPNKVGNPRIIYQYDLQGNLLKVWNSITEAADFYDMSITNISKACQHAIKQCNGFIWRYEDDVITDDDIRDVTINKRKRRVIQYDMKGNYIATYDSLAEASRLTGASDSSIQLCCNRKYRYALESIWRYENDIVTEDDIKFSNSLPVSTRKVYQLDSDSNIIQQYKSINEAAKAVNGYATAITACCKGKVKTAYGYKWKYVE